MNKKKERVGIASGGLWVVDRIKNIDCLPRRGMLANIHSEELSTGGAPANVLADLAKLEAPFPLIGIGVVGNDEDGRFIIDRFRSFGIDVSGITTTNDAPTSYTDVMNEEGTGYRAFFHRRGANAMFGPEHVPIESLTCRIFHLGYLLLLDRMDQPDDEYGTVAARLFCQLRAQGIKTSLDLVSEESDRFKTIVPPALKHVDYLILNEIEAGRVVGREVRNDKGQLDGPALVDATHELCDMGQMEFVAVHMAEGFFIRDQSGNAWSRGSLDVPVGFIKGAVGAGDAFCAGMLYGLHEGWDCGRAGQFGTCCATASLSEGGATDGLHSLAEVQELGERYQEYDPPVKI